MLGAKRLPLDHYFVEGMRQRIEVASIIDKLQSHIDDPAAYPLKQTQLAAARLLLERTVPVLQSIEHKDVSDRPPTREELIERITGIHRRATAKPVDTGANGTDPLAGSTATQH
jgi:hypothetical protein